jgi:hypothetical protein
MAVDMNKISTTNKNTLSSYANNTKKEVIKGNGMYTFVYGKGSNRKSETKHLSESQAKVYKQNLEKQGY